MFSETDLFKFGSPSEEAIDIEMGDDKHIVGFYGAQNADYITQLGIVMQDVNCTVSKAEQMYNSGIKSQIGNSEGDDGSLMLLIVVIAVVVVIVIVVIVVTIIFLRKLSLRR